MSGWGGVELVGGCLRACVCMCSSVEASNISDREHAGRLGAGQVTVLHVLHEHQNDWPIRGFCLFCCCCCFVFVLIFFLIFFLNTLACAVRGLKTNKPSLIPELKFYGIIGSFGQGEGLLFLPLRALV